LSKLIPEFEDYAIYADNARPESISHLKRNGLSRIKACEKGKGSVEDGIAFIQSFKRVYIHPRCKETLNEFRNYSYKKDRLTDEVLPIIIDAYNHYIDSIRYALEKISKGRRKAKPATAGSRTFS